MKRKNVKKIMLHRETLHRLDPSLLGRLAVGGVIPPVETGWTDCVSRCASVCCPNDGGSESFGTCISCGVCSGGCATGGACTL
jgi:hypothetical protein